MQALRHLFEAFIRGGMRGWNPNDPLGYDPATKRRLHDDAEAHPVMKPFDAFNRAVGYPAMAAGDAGLRGVNALVHGGASAANQLMRELGLAGPHDNRLERDLLGIASMGMGSAGRVGGLAGLGGVVVTRGRQAASRGIRMGRQGANALRNPHRAYHTGRVAEELMKAEPRTTGFGRMGRGLFDEINKIRLLENQLPIGARDISVYANVLKKLREKRVNLDGLTPRQVAETIYRVVHGRGTVVERGDFPTSQRLINREGPGAGIGYVGRGPRNEVSVKSIFPADRERLIRMWRGKK